MKKETLKIIFKKLEVEYKKEKEINKVFKKLMELLCDGQYANFITESKFSGILAGIKILNADLEDDISYYFYEAKDMEECICKDKNGKEYDAKNLDEYIDFILINYK